MKEILIVHTLMRIVLYKICYKTYIDYIFLDITSKKVEKFTIFGKLINLGRQ